jgi:3-phosphoshikimate 1-carboxyvinyltransferase
MVSPCQPVVGEIRPPGSKSITNRALICAAMARGDSKLTGVLDSEDTTVMVQAWQQLGLSVDWKRDLSELAITGCGGVLPRDRGDFFIANSGTTIRFLTAALASGKGEFKIHGVPRMHQRPIEDLLDGLRQLGANVKSLNQELPNCPPVQLVACGLDGGESKVAGNVSSQFLSGLMMAAPYARACVELVIDGDLVSKPYVDMTAAVMKSFGVSVREKLNEQNACSGYIIDAPTVYQATNYAIEPDASAASYFFAAAAITGGKVRVLGLSRTALQGDVGFVEVLRKMGCEVNYGDNWIEVSGAARNGIDINMNAISDTVQTLAAVALFVEGPTTIRGVEHNRHKETDRIGDLATELRKLGAQVDEFQDGLRIVPQKLRPAEIKTYHDHRMAMSLSLVGLRQQGVWILDPQCTEKTYPNFFEDLGRLTHQPPVYAS